MPTVDSDVRDARLAGRRADHLRLAVHTNVAVHTYVITEYRNRNTNERCLAVLRALCVLYACSTGLTRCPQICEKQSAKEYRNRNKKERCVTPLRQENKSLLSKKQRCISSTLSFSLTLSLSLSLSLSLTMSLSLSYIFTFLSHSVSHSHIYIYTYLPGS